METLLLKVNENDPDESVLQQAAECLQGGGLVAFPTETVYGLGANGLDPLAAAKIYRAKGRPQDNPLILHIADKQDVYRYASYVPEEAVQLMDAFWPGPLTMVFQKKEVVPMQATGGLNTVALRMPANKIARALISRCGFPIAAPSANISGRPSSTVAMDVWEQLAGNIDIIIDGGGSVCGLESTIVDMTGKPEILRPGFITKEMISAVLGRDISLYQMRQEERPKAPGMKYTHYAPKAQVVLVCGNYKDMQHWISAQSRLKTQEGKICGIMACTENAPYYTSGIVADMGSRNQPEEMGSRLFKTLNWLDRQGAEIIYAEAVDAVGVGEAYMNRLKKASTETVTL